MKTNDPLLEATRHELFERVKRMDELLVTIVKNHIGLEQVMSEFLEASGKEPEKMTFYEKIEACEEQAPQEVEAPLWKVFYAVNELRNKIAHTYDEKKV